MSLEFNGGGRAASSGGAQVQGERSYGGVQWTGASDDRGEYKDEGRATAEGGAAQAGGLTTLVIQ